MTDVKQTTSLRTIDAGIKSVIGHYKKSQDKVQEIALAIMIHAQAYNDCSRAKLLCRAVPARERNSLIGWFSLYSPIGVVMGKTAAEDKGRFIKNTSKFYHDFDIDGAKANNWWDDPLGVNPVNTKPLFHAADFFQMVEKMAERALKQASEGNAKGEDVYDPEDKPLVIAGAQNVLDFTRKLREKQLGKKAAEEAKHDKANEQETASRTGRAVRQKASGTAAQTGERVGPVAVGNAA